MRLTEAEKVAVMRTRNRNGAKTLDTALDLLLTVAESSDPLPDKVRNDIGNFLSAFGKVAT